MNSYTLGMSAAPARKDVEAILSDFVAQKLLLPDPQVVVQGDSEFRVDARMPLAVYNSGQASEVRRRFYALYRSDGLFVDLRLQPYRDGE